MHPSRPTTPWRGTRHAPRGLHRGARLAGRYELLGRIGSGTHSTVHRARDRHTGEVVAVKVLDAHHAGLLPRFLHEQALRIDHPHVLAPTGWVAADDLVALVMPLAPGGSLADLVRRHGPLPTGLVTVLLDQLLAGLTAVHAAGVVHRDVKPANLLLEATGDGPPRLRLADFGVAARVGGPRLTREPGPIGTDGYMAPEQARGAPPDPRQDLHAAGRTAQHLLTGHPTPHTPAAPHPLHRVLAALTDPDPARRPVSARAARSLLPAPAADGPWPDVPDLVGTDQRGRGIAWAAVLVCAATCLACVTRWWSWWA